MSETRVKSALTGSWWFMGVSQFTDDENSPSQQSPKRNEPRQWHLSKGPLCSIFPWPTQLVDNTAVVECFILKCNWVTPQEPTVTWWNDHCKREALWVYSIFERKTIYWWIKWQRSFCYALPNSSGTRPAWSMAIWKPHSSTSSNRHAVFLNILCNTCVKCYAAHWTGHVRWRTCHAAALAIHVSSTQQKILSKFAGYLEKTYVVVSSRRNQCWSTIVNYYQPGNAQISTITHTIYHSLWFFTITHHR